jgi:hypothetical protein
MNHTPDEFASAYREAAREAKAAHRDRGLRDVKIFGDMVKDVDDWLKLNVPSAESAVSGAPYRPWHEHGR